MRRLASLTAVAALTGLIGLAAVPGSQGGGQGSAPAVSKADQRAAEKRRKEAEQWVTRTLQAMTLDEKIGQLLFPSLNAAFLSEDSDAFARLTHLVRDLHVGGFHVFGSSESFPQVMLNPVWGGGPTARKGDPFAAAIILNRLQGLSRVPLLASADFEGGAAYIINGATRLPRGMAIGATRDPQLATRAGEVAAREARALGVSVDFYPVVDVNNNPRNPVINIRSFGEDPALVSEMASAYIQGIHSAGVLATAKHFPGHGDTAVDSHLGLPVIAHPRERLDAVELAPFRAAAAAGVDAVMTSHIVLPALDPAPGIPATLSRPILTGLLRGEMKFDGLIFTDSMSMHAVTKGFPPDVAAAMAVKAGADFVLDSPDDDAAFRGIKAAVAAGEISEAQVHASVERILRAKAGLGLHVRRTVDVAAIPTVVASRAHLAVAQEISEKALTLVKDERQAVPLRAPRDAAVLYLSVIDYASGWREGVPGRTLVPELKARWPNLTAIEITDRTTASEFDLVRALARKADVIVAGVWVRIASYSGRMDLSGAQIQLLESLGGGDKPMVSVLFGNPYTATFLPKLPAVLLTFEFSDFSERAAARALAGEVRIGGKLPIALPGTFPIGHGLQR